MESQTWSLTVYNKDNGHDLSQRMCCKNNMLYIRTMVQFHVLGEIFNSSHFKGVVVYYDHSLTSRLHPGVPQSVPGDWIPNCMGSCHGQILIETATHYWRLLIVMIMGQYHQLYYTILPACHPYGCRHCGLCIPLLHTADCSGHFAYWQETHVQVVLSMLIS